METDNLIKPPLGVEPAFITSVTRIKDLSDAISRQFDQPVVNIDLMYIRKWAKEITMQCDIVMEIGLDIKIVKDCGE